jgi:hypothetical protein
MEFKGILRVAANFIACCYVILLSTGCSKQNALLNAKPNEALAIPNTLSGLQSLLNNENVFNRYDPALGAISSDEYYLPSSNWQSLSTPEEKNGSIWAVDIYDGTTGVGDWDLPYTAIYYSNTVLGQLSSVNIQKNQVVESENILGAALFYRAIQFYNLVQTFAVPYDSSTSNTDLGIPLPLTSNFNAKVTRATEAQCYKQIIGDLDSTLTLLPDSSEYLTSPTKIAAEALLARINLALSNYTSALYYANMVLTSNGNLVDYNTLPYQEYSLTSGGYMNEDIYHSIMNGYSLNTFPIVDTNLYKTYDSTDLRQSLFFIQFGGNVYFKGSYDPRQYSYTGLATDEMYLIRAEAYVRLGQTAMGMNDLNSLLINRYLKGTYIARTAATENEALSQILLERRKELIFRGLRWTDLRRLNEDPLYAVTLSRTIGSTVYTLPPNDPRYAMPIPNDEIQLTSIQQNQR